MKVQFPDTVALFGLPITNVTMTEALTRIERCIRSGRLHQIATANLDFARNSLRNEYLQRIICECSMVLPDGAPMLWASTLFRSRLKERVTGVDLIPQLARLSAEKGYRIFFLGSNEENSSRAAEVLRSRFPEVNICGRLCPPPAPLHEMDNAGILATIAAAKPDILLVAFGNPKQEMWIHRHRDRLGALVAIGIGGSLDMIAGSLVRAPRLVQKLQLEWAFRLAQEPRRLLPRYYHDFVALLKYLPSVWAANKLQPEERRHGKLAIEQDGSVRVICTPARLSGSVTTWLVREANDAIAAGQTVVVDMSATLRVEADGLGGLLEARRLLLEHGLWIWLCGVSHPVRRVLQFSSMADLFRIAATPADAVRYSLATQDSGHATEPYLVRPMSTNSAARIAKAS